jgi:hypothetical protein
VWGCRKVGAEQGSNLMCFFFIVFHIPQLAPLALPEGNLKGVSSENVQFSPRLTQNVNNVPVYFLYCNIYIFSKTNENNILFFFTLFSFHLVLFLQRYPIGAIPY